MPNNKGECVDYSDYWLIGFLAACMVGLIGLIYNNIINKINTIDKHTDKGLELKLDAAEYKITRAWERDLFDGMKLTIKELKDENNDAHKCIMLEIKKLNNNS
jgi:hypothetical protein